MSSRKPVLLPLLSLLSLCLLLTPYTFAQGEEGVAVPPVPRLEPDDPSGKDPGANEGPMISVDERGVSLQVWPASPSPERPGTESRPGLVPWWHGVESMADRLGLRDFNAYTPTSDPYTYPMSTHVKLLMQHEVHVSSVSNCLRHVQFSPCKWLTRLPAQWIPASLNL